MQTNNYHHQQKPFVYLWRDRLLKRYYLGFHSGYNPNYVCSSKSMMEEYSQRPEDFTRRILQVGQREEMAVLERELLQKRKKHLGERYYNKIVPGASMILPAWNKGLKIGPLSEEQKRKQSETMKKWHECHTVKLSEEARRKISVSKKNLSEEARLKISLGQRGKKMSKEARKKMSISGKGRIFSEEHRRNLCKAQKLAWIKRKLSFV